MNEPPILIAYDAWLENQDDTFDSYVQEVKRGWSNPGTILVTAPMYRCFWSWCSKVGISERNTVLRFAHCWHSVRGYHPDRVFTLALCPWKWNVEKKMDDELANQLALLVKLGMAYRYDECSKSGAM